jgi:hypothetical protein
MEYPMEAVGVELQVAAPAARMNGAITFAPLAGLTTIMFDAVWEAPTEMLKSTWLLVPFPQHFT